MPDPDRPGGWSQLAAERFDSGDVAAAEAALREGLAAFPHSVELFFNLGGLLLATGRQRDAEAAFAAAVTHDPNDAEAWMQLGRLRYQRADHAAAAQAFQRAAGLSDAERGTALRLAGFALADAGNPAAASRALEQARAAGADPDLPLLSQLLFCRLELCDWRDRRTLVADCLGQLDAGAVPVEPFTFLLLEEVGPELQLELSRRFCESLQPQRPAAGTSAELGTKRKLRLGYLGDIFHEHATARLATGVIEHHDHDAFEVHAYSYGPDDGSVQRSRLRQSCDAFHDLFGLDMAQTAEFIRGQRIDILIDLNGWTGNTRSALLARRPAAVQVNWLGYPATMGDRRIADYLIGDSIVTPPAMADCYAETLALLPHSYQPNDRSRAAGPRPDRGASGLPAEAFVFCCFNRPLKISESVFDAWCRILRRVPGSVMWLLGGNTEAAGNLVREAEVRGIASERLVFAPPAAQEAHLARLALADLVLDTWPYGAHTTASDALWCGVPVLTRLGSTFSARVASSLLSAIGMDDLAMPDVDAYVERAVELATSRDELLALRVRLAANRLTTPLFDTAGFTRDFEALLQLIWRDHCAGAPARVLALAPARTD